MLYRLHMLLSKVRKMSCLMVAPHLHMNIVSVLHL
jgi:hypothetical protein